MALPEQAQLLTFTVARDEYALDILRVREIARPLPVRPIPGAPSALVGVVHLRQAEAIPILDLRRRFDLPARAEEAAGRIIVCVVEGRLIGLFVDEVLDVIQISVDEVSRGGNVFRGAAAEYFAGICHHHGRLLVLLNLKRLLSSEDRIAIDAVREQARELVAQEAE